MDEQLIDIIDKIFKKSNEEKTSSTYHSEKIIKKTSIDKIELTKKIKKMLQIRPIINLYVWEEEFYKEQFYLQAEFMKDCETSTQETPYKLEINIEKPFYCDLSLLQLEKYFYWRTDIKNDNEAYPNKTFIMLYLSEILNNVGIRSKEEGFWKIMYIYYKFKNMYSIDIVITLLLKEYVVYNNLDRTFIDKIPSIIFTTAFCLQEIHDCINSGNYLNFTNKLDDFSSYTIRTSKFYAKYKNDYDEVLKLVFIVLHEFYLKNRKIKLFVKLFGKGIKIENCELFKPAVFYDEGLETFEYVINDFEKYIVKRGIWTRYLYFEGDFNKLLIGEILKTTEFYLRNFYMYPQKIKVKSTSEILTNLIEETVMKYCIDNKKLDLYTKLNKKSKLYKENNLNNENVLENPKEINIDVSKFDAIRSISEKIQEKLIIEPEQAIEKPIERIEKPLNGNDYKKAEELKGISGFVAELSHVEKTVLSYILNNQNEKIQQVLNDENIMLSILLENINEKSLVYIDDNILDSDCIYIYDEYIDELKEIL